MRIGLLTRCSVLVLGQTLGVEGTAGRVAELIQQLGEKDSAVREQAALEIGRLGPGAEAAIPALAAALEYSGENDVPPLAAWALGEIGPAAVPSLAASIEGHNEWVREPVALALARIGGPGVAVLTERLGSTDAYVRDAVAGALGKMGSRAAQAVPALIEASRKSTQRRALSWRLAESER